jgi:hypothetical protein
MGKMKVLRSSLPTTAKMTLLGNFGRQENIHCKHFSEVLRSFEAALPEKYKTRFSLHGKHSWSEFVAEAKDAEAKYFEEGR